MAAEAPGSCWCRPGSDGTRARAGGGRAEPHVTRGSRESRGFPSRPRPHDSTCCLWFRVCGGGAGPGAEAPSALWSDPPRSLAPTQPAVCHGCSGHGAERTWSLLEASCPSGASHGHAPS